MERATLFSALTRKFLGTTLLNIISNVFSETICDVVKLSSNSKSNRYRLHSTKFPLMITARDKVSVLLTRNSRDSSFQYQIIIGSNGNILLQSKAGEQSKKLTESNVTAPLLKENETRIFWIDIEKDRVVFGSGEKVRLKKYSACESIFTTCHKRWCVYPESVVQRPTQSTSSEDNGVG